MHSSVNNLVEQGQEWVDDATDRARTLSKRGLRVAGNAARQAMDTYSDTTDSVLRYTKKNPAKALLIAAGTGAALFALAKLFAPSRD